jgi:protein associated with RNAse G/E
MLKQMWKEAVMLPFKRSPSGTEGKFEVPCSTDTVWCFRWPASCLFLIACNYNLCASLNTNWVYYLTPGVKYFRYKEPTTTASRYCADIWISNNLKANVPNKDRGHDTALSTVATTGKTANYMIT